MSTIKLGNAPCSWGTLEFGSSKDDRIGYEQMLDELVEAGYTGSELGDYGFMPTSPEQLADAFARRNLTLTGAFMGVKLRDDRAHADGRRRALRIATLLADTAERLQQEAPPFFVLADDNGTDPVRTQHAGRIQPEMMLDVSDWSTFAEGAEMIARAVREETGLPTVFHPHCAGYVETEQEIAFFLEYTDPALLGIVFDTGHFAYGEGTCDGVVDGLKRFWDRIRYVHFKDYDADVGQEAAQKEWDYFEAVRHGVFSELGDGCVDFASVVDWLHDQNYQGYVTVEQDVLAGMGAPMKSAIRNRAFLRSLDL